MKWHKTSEETPDNGRACLCRHTSYTDGKPVYCYDFCFFDDNWMQIHSNKVFTLTYFTDWVSIAEITKELES